ncbi:MAG: DUF4058 family protein [Anaerolineae bacterium]|nr:DUF4058 family protein [Anaerolineae bacterium]
MSIRTRRNPYTGVNAHLNSLLRSVPCEWESFHAAHIVDLTRALNARLPSGYEARTERSLQIREVALSEDAAEARRQRPQPDGTGFEVEKRSAHSPISGTPPAALVLSVLETTDVDPEAFLSAVVIYQIQEDNLFGTPITRVELLSPANKPHGASYAQYREKRNAAQRSRMPLVEIDYLHQSPPVIKSLPSYSDRQPNAYPYTVIVSDPRPTLSEGVARLYLFGANALVPLIDIPLVGDDVFTVFDLGAVYNTTYPQTLTCVRVADYSALPLNFERYAPEAQALLRASMATFSEMYSAHQLE